MIRQQARIVGLTISEYLRESGLKGPAVSKKKVLSKEALQFTGTLNHLAANLNQIAKKRNSMDELNALERVQLQDLSSQVHQLALGIKNLLEMIGKIIIGKSFSGCIKYCLNVKVSEDELMHKNSRADVLCYNQVFW